MTPKGLMDIRNPWCWHTHLCQSHIFLEKPRALLNLPADNLRPQNTTEAPSTQQKRSQCVITLVPKDPSASPKGLRPCSDPHGEHQQTPQKPTGRPRWTGPDLPGRRSTDGPRKTPRLQLVHLCLVFLVRGLSPVQSPAARRARSVWGGARGRPALNKGNKRRKPEEVHPE